MASTPFLTMDMGAEENEKASLAVLANLSLGDGLDAQRAGLAVEAYRRALADGQEKQAANQAALNVMRRVS